MEYNRRLQAAIDRFLTEDDWHYSFDDERGLFRFNVTLESKLKKVNCTLLVRKNHFTVYAVAPMNADDCKEEMTEFITRANYGLVLGEFEMDWRDGEVRYGYTVRVEDDEIPNTANIHRAIYTPISMMKRYGDGIVAVMFGMKSAEQAINDIENN